MKAIVVGSGAGGATAARELAGRGFEVVVLEAGEEFKPFTRHLGWASALRRAGLLGDERLISRIYPPLDVFRSSEDLLLVRGMTTGGSTSIACGNIVRAEYGLEEIGLDLSTEFEEMEALLKPRPVPSKRWRSASKQMFEAADELGLEPKPTPKAIEQSKCASCGLCELGCANGAKWDARRFLADAMANGAEVQTGSKVRRVVIEGGQATGVVVGERKQKTLKADVVVLTAGGIGTAQILKASGLEAKDRLWADIVLTVGGTLPNARQLNEVPMPWYAKRDHYILSPYIDILSHWFHKPWRDVPIKDRVGLMIKFADSQTGAVSADGTVDKALTAEDNFRLEGALALAIEVMENAGISGPFVNGALNGGHFGGTVPLTRDDVHSMHPAGLPENLWVADLSLMPQSQGLPTILTTCALALKVARAIPK